MGVDQMGRILAEADRMGDQAAAAKYGVDVVSIVRARTRLSSDEQLRAAHSAAREELAREWRHELSQTAVDLARALSECVQRREDPPRGLIEAVRVVAAACLQSDALLGGGNTQQVVLPRRRGRPAKEKATGGGE